MCVASRTISQTELARGVLWLMISGLGVLGLEFRVLYYKG